jgi:ribosomal protein L24E
MKGLLFYNRYLDKDLIYHCNNCGNKIIPEEGAWIYKEPDCLLFFCNADCRDEFLELNNMQD